MGQLDDVLPEVGLHHLDALRLQGGVEVDLLGGHRLRLDRQPHALGPGDAVHDPARLLRAGRPVHGHAQRFQLGLEAVEPAVEVAERLPADGRPPPALLDHVRVGAGSRPLGPEGGGHLGQRRLEVGVVDGPPGPLGQRQRGGGFRFEAHRIARPKSSAT